MRVAVKLLSEESVVPAYATDGAAGFDLPFVSDGIEQFVLEPLDRAAIPTGLAFAVPEGYELQIRPRSGLALKKGITVLNSPGTIDSDYRGEVKVSLMNLGTEPLVLSRGDRIAQAILCEVPRAEFEVVDDLDETARGSGGFGSTGT